MTSHVEFKVHIPVVLDSLKPFEIHDKATGVAAAIVERYALASLPEDWDTSDGVYVLFSPIAPDNTFRAHVGQNVSSFKAAVTKYPISTQEWTVALLFQNTRKVPLNPMERTYLETNLVSALSSSTNVEMFNSRELANLDFSYLEEENLKEILLTMLRIMFLRGYRNSHMADTVRKLEIQSASSEMDDSSYVNDSNILRSLQQWREQVATDSGMHLNEVATNPELQLIAERQPIDAKELAALNNLRAHLREGVLAEQILDLINY